MSQVAMNQQAPDPSVWPPPAPAQATSCPKCQAPTQPSRSAQKCGKCGRKFMLIAGPLLDTAVKPPELDPKAKSIVVRSSGMVLNNSCTLGADAVQYGTLDPVTGRFPIDTTTVPYRFIFSITIQKRVSVPAAIAWIVLGIPLLAGAVAMAFVAWQAAVVFSLPIAALTLLVGYNTFFVKAWHVRIVGIKNQIIETRFDKPWWRRKKFHAELFRRTGLEAPGSEGL